MSRNRDPRTNGWRHWVGLGAAAGGMLVAALSQLAMAPSAHADPFTDLVSNVEGTFGLAETQFSAGAGDFSSSDIPDGLSNYLAGTDTFLFGPGYDVLVDGYAALTGGTQAGSYYFPADTPPADFADAETAIQGYTNGAETYFTEAAGLLSSDPVQGLVDLANGSGLLVGEVPDEFILGLGAALGF
ncbi:hypothetical protein [Mycobacterium sp.]|uniref:hypothetical protein n=1 Tax=Mycobacterium sp. TaxID=1785 RepID=UPI003BB10794